MKLRTVFSVVSTIMLATTGYAGTMGPVVESDFSGFYAGLGAGGTTLFNKDIFSITVPGVGVVRSGTNRDTDSAVIFSGQVGYGAMYTPSTYLGLKASVFYTPIEDTERYPYSSGPTLLVNGVDNFSRTVKPIYNIDAVLGFEFIPQFLSYVEGGVSFANVKHNFTATGTVTDLGTGVIGEYFGSQILDNYKTGYNVGIGANYLASRNWVLSSELVYNYLGKKNITLTNFALPLENSATHSRSETNQAVSLIFGASYLFSGF